MGRCRKEFRGYLFVHLSIYQSISPSGPRLRSWPRLRSGPRLMSGHRHNFKQRLGNGPKSEPSGLAQRPQAPLAQPSRLRPPGPDLRPPGSDLLDLLDYRWTGLWTDGHIFLGHYPLMAKRWGLRRARMPLTIYCSWTSGSLLN